MKILGRQRGEGPENPQRDWFFKGRRQLSRKEEGVRRGGSPPLTVSNFSPRSSAESEGGRSDRLSFSSQAGSSTPLSLDHKLKVKPVSSGLFSPPSLTASKSSSGGFQSNISTVINYDTCHRASTGYSSGAGRGEGLSASMSNGNSRHIREVEKDTCDLGSKGGAEWCI